MNNVSKSLELVFPADEMGCAASAEWNGEELRIYTGELSAADVALVYADSQ